MHALEGQGNRIKIKYLDLDSLYLQPCQNGSLKSKKVGGGGEFRSTFYKKRNEPTNKPSNLLLPAYLSFNVL